LATLNPIIPPELLLTYLGVLFFLGLAAMAADKTSAKLGFDRISERTLALLALAGGFTGVILGGLFFHHKTSKPEFWVPVGLATILWGAVLLVYYLPPFLRF
jgi:uncharacterized membrane protein YsdA (DUF1294 family)